MLFVLIRIASYTQTQKKVCTLYLVIFWKSKDGILSCVVSCFSLFNYLINQSDYAIDFNNLHDLGNAFREEWNNISAHFI